MSEKETTILLKQLARVIERQAEYASQLTTQMTTTLRMMNNLQARISRLERLENDE
jgi:hypothetical protein